MPRRTLAACAARCQPGALSCLHACATQPIVTCNCDQNQSGRAMTQTTNRFFDELAKLMTDAAGAAQGLRREFETLMKSQGERILREMDVVRRDEFEAVKAMAQRAREENDALTARVAALEAELAQLKSKP